MIISRGRLWDSKKDIEKEIIHFFKHLYMGDNRLQPWLNAIPFKFLSSLSVASLEISFSKEEIRAAVFGLGGIGLQA